MDLIIFAFTNAYDVYSTQAINEVGENIVFEKIDEHYYLFCSDADPVETVMKTYDFTYERYNNVQPTDDIKPNFKTNCHHVYRSIGNYASMCDYCGDIKMNHH